MEQSIIKVIDQNDHEYQCDINNPIGRGGQGMVLMDIDDDCIAIKIATDSEGKPVEDKNEINKYCQETSSLMLFPIEPNSKISMPVSFLTSHEGYVMRFLGDMDSLNKLMFSKVVNEKLVNIPLPIFIDPKQLPSQEPNFLRSFKALSWYALTGGLRTRLDILIQVADIIGGLHASGLVFGDLSPNNVLLTTGDLKNRTAWIIDVDNIRFEGKGLGAYTPRFCAPEVTKGIPTTSYSDTYSFALIAFELLTMINPFDGKACKGDEKIDQGEVPWIFDPNDTSNFLGDLNQASILQFCITPHLFKVFDKTFGEGRLEKEKRPLLWRYRQALLEAYDMGVECPHCHMNWFVDSELNNICPYCDHKLSLLLEVSQNDSIIFAREFGKDPIILKRHIFEPCDSKSDFDVLKISLDGEDFEFEVIDIRISLSSSENNDYFLQFFRNSFSKYQLLLGIYLKVKSSMESIRIKLVEGNNEN